MIVEYFIVTITLGGFFIVTKTDLEVKWGGVSEITGMLALDAKLYPVKWQVNTDFVLKALSKNPHIYRVLKVNGKVVGYYSLLPVLEWVYEQVLSGGLFDSEINNYITPYKEDSDTYLYLSSIIVDITDPNSRKYTKCLLKDILTTLDWLSVRGINVRELGCILISEDGKRITRKIGFKITEDLVLNNTTYCIARASVKDLLSNIKI